MVNILYKNGNNVLDPNDKTKILSYHVDKRLKAFLDDKVRERVTKKDKDYILLVDGYEGCLTGDTIIRCNRATLGRKYTLKWMFNQYHKNIEKAKHFKQWNLNIPTYVRSFDGKRIGLHEI